LAKGGAALYFQVLIEDQSSAALIELLMEKITKDFDFVTWNVKSFRGIGGFTKKNTTKETKTGKLLNDLATYLSGFDKSLRHVKPSAVFVVLDNDKRDQAAFARQLKELAARRNITIDHVFCIAVEEVEAWLLGDREAVIKAYPRAKRAALDTYQQDSICRTWECLADVIYHGGRERIKKGCPTYVERGKCKREWAVNIGRHMCPDANVSPSFRYFLNEIRKRILRAKE